jgi:hypothetical protein
MQYKPMVLEAPTDVASQCRWELGETRVCCSRVINQVLKAIISLVMVTVMVTEDLLRHSNLVHTEALLHP